jgi:hypothetical protein
MSPTAIDELSRLRIKLDHAQADAERFESNWLAAEAELKDVRRRYGDALAEAHARLAEANADIARLQALIVPTL